jgi:hypothetical protein
MNTHLHRCRPLLFALCVLWGLWGRSPASGAAIPATAPRTQILAGRHEAFRAYCTGGDGAAAFAKLKADLDAKYLALPFPAAPVT